MESKWRARKPEKINEAIAWIRSRVTSAYEQKIIDLSDKIKKSVNDWLITSNLLGGVYKPLKAPFSKYMYKIVHDNIHFVNSKMKPIKKNEFYILWTDGSDGNKPKSVKIHEKDIVDFAKWFA